VTRVVSITSAGAPPFTISDGEVNCILGFLHDGSIAAEPWHRLMGAWGYCERHAWTSLVIEMAMLKGFVSRSAFLYFDLLQQAVDVLGARTRTLAKRLGERNPCMICEINPRRRGWLSDAEISEARDQGRLRSFADELAPLWRESRCPRCLGLETSGRLCRRHLHEAIETHLPVAIDDELRYLLSLTPRVETYAKSFMWQHRGTDRAEDRAALLAAIGWCSGWSPLASIAPLGFRHEH
jgi:hypothetical protein